MADYKDLLLAVRDADINLKDDAQLQSFIKSWKAGQTFDPQPSAHRKDTLTPQPDGSYRSDTGWLYQNGPFSLLEDDPLSLVIAGGSPTLRWLPTRLYTERYTSVGHLEYVAPEGYDGSTSYREWLASVEIPECDYGPTTVWNGFEYRVDGGSFSWQSPVVTIKDFGRGGQRDFEKSPVYTVRGPNAGRLAVNNDADWGVARALIAAEQHLNYVVLYGDRRNSPMEWDGIDTIMTPGYVQARTIGAGTPHWANPYVMNGANLSTPEEILTAIRIVVRRLRQRASDRNWTLNAGDIAVVMPASFWSYLAEALAKNGGYSGVPVSEYRDFIAEMQRLNGNGDGYGVLSVEGFNVTVIPDSTMGSNVTINPGDAEQSFGVVGDIYILVRRAGGMTMWEQQYLDWNAFDYPADDDVFSILGGVARSGWKELNKKCFQYFVEMEGRLVCSFLPLQGRINNVVIETMSQNEVEGGMFWQQDFYAFDGRRGGSGQALLTPW